MAGRNYKVNLLPPKLQRESVVDVRRLVVLAGTTTGVALVVGGYAAFLLSFWGLRGELAAAEQQLASLRPLAARVEKVRAERQNLERLTREITQLRGQRFSWATLCTELERLAPVDLWLREVALGGAGEASARGAGTPSSLTLKGVSRTVASVGVFQKNLSALSCFESVVLQRVSAEEEGFAFEITCFLKKGA